MPKVYSRRGAQMTAVRSAVKQKTASGQKTKTATRTQTSNKAVQQLRQALEVQSKQRLALKREMVTLQATKTRVSLLREQTSAAGERSTKWASACKACADALVEDHNNIKRNRSLILKDVIDVMFISRDTVAFASEAGESISYYVRQVVNRGWKVLESFDVPVKIERCVQSYNDLVNDLSQHSATTVEASGSSPPAYSMQLKRVPSSSVPLPRRVSEATKDLLQRTSTLADRLKVMMGNPSPPASTASGWRLQGAVAVHRLKEQAAGMQQKHGKRIHWIDIAATRARVVRKSLARIAGASSGSQSARALESAIGDVASRLAKMRQEIARLSDSRGELESKAADADIEQQKWLETCTETNAIARKALSSIEGIPSMAAAAGARDNKQSASIAIGGFMQARLDAVRRMHDKICSWVKEQQHHADEGAKAVRRLQPAADVVSLQLTDAREAWDQTLIKTAAAAAQMHLALRHDPRAQAEHSSTIADLVGLYDECADEAAVLEVNRNNREAESARTRELMQEVTSMLASIRSSAQQRNQLEAEGARFQQQTKAGVAYDQVLEGNQEQDTIRAASVFSEAANADCESLPCSVQALANPRARAQAPEEWLARLLKAPGRRAQLQTAGHGSSAVVGFALDSGLAASRIVHTAEIILGKRLFAELVATSSLPAMSAGLARAAHTGLAAALRAATQAVSSLKIKLRSRSSTKADQVSATHMSSSLRAASGKSIQAALAAKPGAGQEEKLPRHGKRSKAASPPGVMRSASMTKSSSSRNRVSDFAFDSSSDDESVNARERDDVTGRPYSGPGDPRRCDRPKAQHGVTNHGTAAFLSEMSTSGVSAEGGNAEDEDGNEDDGGLFDDEWDTSGASSLFGAGSAGSARGADHEMAAKSVSGSDSDPPVLDGSSHATPKKVHALASISRRFVALSAHGSASGGVMGTTRSSVASMQISSSARGGSALGRKRQAAAALEHAFFGNGDSHEDADETQSSTGQRDSTVIARERVTVGPRTAPLARSRASISQSRPLRRQGVSGSRSGTQTSQQEPGGGLGDATAGVAPGRKKVGWASRARSGPHGGHQGTSQKAEGSGKGTGRGGARRSTALMAAKRRRTAALAPRTGVSPRVQLAGGSISDSDGFDLFNE